MLRGPLRTLLLGQSLGQLADGLAQVSFAGFVLFDIGAGATPARIAAVLAVTLLPFSVVGPVAGVFIDRWDRRRTLIATSVCRAVVGILAVAVVVLRSEPLAYVGALLLLSLSRFVLDAKSAALPATVAPADLVQANAVSAFAGLAATFVGAVTGAVGAAAGAAIGFVVAAACYLGAAAVFARLPDVGGGHPRDALAAGLARTLRALGVGFRAIGSTPDLRRPLLAVWVHRALLGAGFVLLVLVTDSRYHFRTSGYALALGVTGVSTVIGTWVAPWLVGRWRPQALLAMAFVPPAAVAVVVGYSPGLAGLLGALAVTAASFQILKVVCDALVGRTAAARLRGRVFAVYDVLYNVAFVVAGLAMVPLWDSGRVRGLLWWLAAAYGAAWLVVARSTGSWPFLSTRPAAAVRVARRTAWIVRLAALVAGALPVFAFPRPAVWWLAWFALVPWLLLIRAAPTWRAAADRGWWAAMGFLLGVHYWLLGSTGPFLLVIAVLLGSLWVPWSMLTWWLLREHAPPWRGVAALVAVPAGWVLVESVRSWSALGGPWGLLGASQWNSPAQLAPASLGGVWLVSLLIVTANVALVDLLVRPRLRRRLAVAGCLVAVLAAGPGWYHVEGRAEGAQRLRVAMVQPGVIAGAGPRLAREIALTRRVRPGSVDLVSWGESSVGYDVFSHPGLQAALESLARHEGADLLVNVDARTPTGAIEKVAVLVGPNALLGSYQKMRLVPFGEYIPLRPVLGWLADVTKAAAVNRSRGTHLVVLRSSQGVRFAPLICFEIAFPDMARNDVRAGAQLLVFQSASSTFQGSWEPDQQASLAAVRAVETGRPAVQSALSGTSAAFAPDGTRLAWFSSDRRGVVVVTVPLTARATPFERFGDWVLQWAWLVLAATALAASLDAARVRPSPESTAIDATGETAVSAGHPLRPGSAARS
ncbi:MAG TPA: apolipoprotein N-acyltransferase [Jatrophihabitans sp.]|nr:apolipoprotein N-acyltransferase [Jatrophihabitans sp.]